MAITALSFGWSRLVQAGVEQGVWCVSLGPQRSHVCIACVLSALVHLTEKAAKVEPCSVILVELHLGSGVLSTDAVKTVYATH